MTLRQVSSCDTVAYVARLLLVFAWAAIPLVIIFMAFNDKRPEESPAEIAFIMTCFTAAFLAVIQKRKAKVTRMIMEGTPVKGTLFCFSRYQFFITVGVRFYWRGEQKERMVQLPAVGATSVIRDREYVTLMVDPQDYRRLVIKELYAPERGL